jgi:hypothetical protein
MRFRFEQDRVDGAGRAGHPVAWRGTSRPAAVRNFFWDDEENVWVIPVTERERQQRVAHVFDPAGRFLGEVSFPFRLSGQPYPVFRDGFMYAVTTDELEVPYVVRARLEKGGASE